MSLSFNIDTAHPTPLYHQLERAIRFAIATGKLAVGDQLPTVRQLAVDLRINANTVAKVYLELERAGVVETRRGVGTFVRARPLAAAHEKDREHELRELEDHFLSTAAHMGFSAKEALEHLRDRLKKKK
ncbi:MAG: GntR family transcriptional regulator [Acidobacteriota bacterium]